MTKVKRKAGDIAVRKAKRKKKVTRLRVKREASSQSTLYGIPEARSRLFACTVASCERAGSTLRLWTEAARVACEITARTQPCPFRLRFPLILTNMHRTGVCAKCLGYSGTDTEKLHLEYTDDPSSNHFIASVFGIGA